MLRLTTTEGSSNGVQVAHKTSA